MMVSNFFRKDLQDFKAYEAEENSFRIKLDANESFLSFPKELQGKLTEAVQSALFNRYPDPSSRKVCKLYGEYAKVKSDNVMAGNGSDELIQIIVNAFVTSGDKVMSLSPDFSMYEIYTKIAGGIPVGYNLDKDFNLDAEALISEVNGQGINILFISNPNNPTGGVIPKSEILKIVKGCKCIVVIDEAYYEFYGSTVAEEIENYENLIILRTCSKALGLAALRLGFLITNCMIMNELKKVKPPYNVNTITQKIGEVILSNPKIIQDSVKSILKERNYLIDGLKVMEGIKVNPTEANFILIETENASKIKEKASAQGISIRSFNSERLKNCLRICAGNREENEAFLKSMV